jgi:transcriptional regulator with XRE-family HTH domain
MEKTMSLGEKLKSARKSAGLTQEQLANKLVVSRQAITKWESDKGMPDIENLKKLSKLLNVSVDYLVDDGEKLDLTVIREEINLDDYPDNRKFRGRLNKKTGKKDMVVRTKYPNAEIYDLVAHQILTKGEKVLDWALGLTFSSFGAPQTVHDMENVDKKFYLVNDDDKQFLVTVTDDFIESRQLASKITDKKFSIGKFKFVRGVMLPKNQED